VSGPDRPGSAFGVHIADQVAAAQEQAAGVFERLERTFDGETTHQVGVPSWIAARLRERRDVCAHLASGPVLAVAAAWAPAVWRCPACFPEIDGPARGSVEDRTCDRCRAVDTEGTHPMAARLGGLLFVAGVCGRCRASIAAGSNS
jgi:hypothetical protein